jgi:hypothetical protein
MKKTFAIIAFSAVIPFSGIAQAEVFPDWRNHQMCNAGDSICVRYEQFARGQISGTWRTLPQKHQAACIAEAEKIGKSYRLLQGCLAIAMQEHLRDQHRNPPTGDVVHKTPMAKRPEPPAPEPAPAPAPAAEPETPAATKPQ